MAFKIGAEDRKKVAIAGLLGVVLLFLAGRMVYQDFATGSPAPAAPTPPVVRSGASPGPGSSAGSRRGPAAVPVRAHAGVDGGDAAMVAASASMAKLDPTLHPEWMAQAESLEYTGKGRNIFSMSSAPAEIEEVKGAIRPGAAGPPVATGPPPPPPIDLKFFGFEASKGGPRKAFLLHGDDVFIAAEGDVVDHRYRVVKIAPFSMQIEDIPYHNTQTIPLVQN